VHLVDRFDQASAEWTMSVFNVVIGIVFGRVVCAELSKNAHFTRFGFLSSSTELLPSLDFVRITPEPV
jgi:hypothetical protein